ncbi:MAG: PilZ domain-containing protein [Clostridiales bacterium]|nr:PilZ domain-containing protein [Clostridiales bacterium]
MKEKRQYKRYSIKGGGRASDDSDQNCKFIMNNISAGGMSITTEKELKEESPLTIQLDKAQLRLPPTQPHKGMIVRKKEESDAYHYGIRLSGQTKTETQEIDTYLRDEHFASLAQMVKNPDDMDNKK